MRVAAFRGRPPTSQWLREEDYLIIKMGKSLDCVFGLYLTKSSLLCAGFLNAIELYRSLGMTYWLPTAEASLSEILSFQWRGTAQVRRMLFKMLSYLIITDLFFPLEYF